MTTSRKSDPAPTKPPGMMQAAFWVAIVGLSIIVIVGVVLLGLKEQAIQFQIDSPERKFSPEEIRRIVTIGVWLNLGVSVVFGLLAAYFVRQVRAGERKARLRFVLVSAALVVFIFFFGSLLSVFGMLFLIVSLGMVFAGSVTKYLNEQS